MSINGKMFHDLVKIIRQTLIGLAPTFTHKTLVSKEGYGKTTYSAGTTIKAFVTKKQRQVLRKSDGREVVSSYQLIIPENYVVDVVDQIVFPDGSTPPILDVQPILDELMQPIATEVLF